MNMIITQPKRLTMQQSDNGQSKSILIFIDKAKIQKELGVIQEQWKAQKKSLELASEDKKDDYVKMNEALLKKLKINYCHL